MEEIWKDIPGYEGLYQVSSEGRVKSLPRLQIDGRITLKEKILKSTPLSGWYLAVALYNDRKKKTHRVHKLVAMAFLGHEPNGHNVVIDHINNIQTDNRVENLQLISARENLSKDRGKGSSKFIGVTWRKDSNKWRSSIRIYDKDINLGSFEKEERAAEIYQLALQNVHLFDGDTKKFRDLINSL